MNISGVNINNLSRDEVHMRVDAFLGDKKFHRIATVNPEFLVEADRNPTFREALQSADLRVADGAGISLAFLLHGSRLKCRYPGADLMEYLLAKAEHDGIDVFLAVRKDGLSTYEEMRTALSKKYPRLMIGGNNADVSDLKSYKLQTTSHTLLFCNFGTPEQELFLDSLKNDPGSIRLAMGVGGAFDYLTGKQKRAPSWMRAIGLEWLWRLMLQPKRFTRIWNATVVFLWKVV